jgi:hypothetical protein
MANARTAQISKTVTNSMVRPPTAFPVYGRPDFVGSGSKPRQALTTFAASIPRRAMALRVSTTSEAKRPIST